MIGKLNDARIALGWGLTFLGYGAFLLWDYYRASKQSHTDTVARLVAGDAASRADEMRRGEFMLPRENVEIEP